VREDRIGVATGEVQCANVACYEGDVMDATLSRVTTGLLDVSLVDVDSDDVSDVWR